MDTTPPTPEAPRSEPALLAEEQTPTRLLGLIREQLVCEHMSHLYLRAACVADDWQTWETEQQYLGAVRAEEALESLAREAGGEDLVDDAYAAGKGRLTAIYVEACSKEGRQELRALERAERRDHTRIAVLEERIRLAPLVFRLIAGRDIDT